MLIYCFAPVTRSFESSLPGFVRAMGSERISLTRFDVEPDQVGESFGEPVGGNHNLTLDTVSVGPPSGEDGRATIEFESCTRDRSLLSMSGELTLSRVGPALCHLSLGASITGTLAAGLMYNRTFQMTLELAIADFLSKVASSGSQPPNID